MIKVNFCVRFVCVGAVKLAIMKSDKKSPSTKKKNPFRLPIYYYIYRLASEHGASDSVFQVLWKLMHIVPCYHKTSTHFQAVFRTTVSVWKKRFDLISFLVIYLGCAFLCYYSLYLYASFTLHAVQHDIHYYLYNLRMGRRCKYTHIILLCFRLHALSSLMENGSATQFSVESQ